MKLRWFSNNCVHGEDVGVDCFYSSSNSNPAFYAEASSSYPISSISANQTLIFRRVIYNEGGHYNSGSGKFTAAIPGTYVFHLGLKPSGNVPVKAHIMRYTNDRLAVVDSDDGHGYVHFASNMAILKLSKNQIVFVQVDNPQSSGATLNNELNFFSGFLLHRDL
ncbi:C1q-related factor-like [Saccostrea cucullata]|uniref:C1q-related factor-like n=1 Tax=Saccostrea cuccullata TaxID=36930 RepID=UPI002ED49A0D